MPDVASQATIADARQNRSLIGRQQRAWRYYGLPKENTHSSGDVDGMSAAIGEVRYVVGWMAEQMSRLRWLVTINGEDSWSVVTPDGEEISTADVDDDGEAFEDQAAASQQLLRIVGWDDETVRQITTNLFVAGALDYVADPGPGGSDQPDPDMWQVVSTIRPDREKILKRALFSVKGLWPHAADPNEPDAPLFGVLDVCATIEWLSKLSWSQSANRVAMNGWLAVADGLEFGDGGDFYVRMNQITRAIMRDPMMGASPAVLRGAKELTEPGAGGGPKGMSYLIPNRPYDATIDRRLQHAIQRLAYGLPIPPEILLGMTATNRAVAYQVEECLAPDTRVLTADLRWVQVGDLKVDDELAAFDEGNDEGAYSRKWRRSTVEAAGRAELPCYEVTLADGTVFVASENHQWLYRDSGRRTKWVTTAWLHQAMTRPQRKQPPTVMKALDTWEPDESRAAGYLAGVFDGEGHLTGLSTQGGFTLGFGQRDNACLALTETYAAALGFDLRRYGEVGASVNGPCYHSAMRGGQAEVLRFLGQVRPGRLLDKYEACGGPEQIGAFLTSLVDVVSVRPVGRREVVTLRTSTGTIVAEGYAHHNSSYRAHVEPPAQLVSRVAEGALAKVLPSVGEILVEPDPTLLLARRHSVADVKDGWQMGLIGARFAREVLGVPEDAAPTQEDLVLLAFIRSLTGQVPREQDPASRAGNEAVQASVFLHPLVGRSGAPNGDGAGRPEAVSAASAVEGDLDDLGRTLAEVDFQVRSELNGAAAMAVERARDRIGAAARSRRDLRDEIPSDVPNGEVAATVGMQLLRDVGVDVDQVVADAMEPLADWWTGRLGTAQESLTALFGQGADAPVVEPDWDETDLTASRDMLVSGLIAQTIGQAEQKHPPGPDPDLLRSVMAVAGGEHDGAIVAALTPAGWTPTPAAPGGLGVGVKTMQALKDNGIVHTGWRWLWRPGVLGGEFEPHRSLGGTFHPLDGIPTPTGYAPGMPNPPCVIEGTVVEATAVSSVSARAFEGVVVRLATAGGNELTVTPNHPVLTDKGWVPAHLLDVGSHVVGCTDIHEATGRTPHDDHRPALAEDVFEAACLLATSRRDTVEGSPLQFHGDGRDGEVHVVRVDRTLGDRQQSSGFEPVMHEGFPFAVVAPRSLDPGSTPDLLVEAGGTASAGLVGSGSPGASLFGAESLVADDVLFAGGPKRDAGLGEDANNRLAGAPELTSNRLNGVASAIRGHDAIDVETAGALDGPVAGSDPVGLHGASDGGRAGPQPFCEGLVGSQLAVHLDKIVAVERLEYSGHVYNLSTDVGFYSANGILSHNCMCDLQPVLRRETGVFAPQQVAAGA